MNPVDTSFLAILSNLLLSLLLIGLSASIYFMPELAIGDLFYVCIYAMVIFCVTIPAFNSVILTLMEGAPGHINVESVRRDIERECGYDLHGIHDLHIWTIAIGQVAMTCHLQSVKPLKTMAQVTNLLRRKYGLFHTTLQVEGVEDRETNPHTFKCENDIHQ